MSLKKRESHEVQECLPGVQYQNVEASNADDILQTPSKWSNTPFAEVRRDGRRDSTCSYDQMWMQKHLGSVTKVPVLTPLPLHFTRPTSELPTLDEHRDSIIDEETYGGRNDGATPMIKGVSVEDVYGTPAGKSNIRERPPSFFTVSPVDTTRPHHSDSSAMKCTMLAKRDNDRETEKGGQPEEIREGDKQQKIVEDEAVQGALVLFAKVKNEESSEDSDHEYDPDEDNEEGGWGGSGPTSTQGSDSPPELPVPGPGIKKPRSARSSKATSRALISIEKSFTPLPGFEKGKTRPLHDQKIESRLEALAKIDSGRWRKQCDQKALQVLKQEDPRKAKRIIANRRSAEASRLRRLNKIATLSSEVKSLSEKVHRLEAENRMLKSELNEKGGAPQCSPDAMEQKDQALSMLQTTMEVMVRRVQKARGGRENRPHQTPSSKSEAGVPKKSGTMSKIFSPKSFR